MALFHHKTYCGADHPIEVPCHAPDADEMIAQIAEIIHAYEENFSSSHGALNQIVATVLNPLQRALLVRAANTECNLLKRLYGYTTSSGMVIFGTETSWDQQVYALRAAIEVLDQ